MSSSTYSLIFRTSESKRGDFIAGGIVLEILLGVELNIYVMFFIAF